MILGCFPVHEYVHNCVERHNASGTYDGQRKLFIKHGEGKLAYIDGEFIGEFRFGSRRRGVEEWMREVKEKIPPENLEGAAALRYSADERASGFKVTIVSDKYDGEYRHNKPHGKGKLQYGINNFLADEEYDGQWVGGRRHGRGRILRSNGDIHIGEFRHDSYHGWGIYSKNSGQDWYVGTYAHGEKHGRGIEKTEDGVYHGGFLNGKRHGIGKFAWRRDEIQDVRVLPRPVHDLDPTFWRCDDVYIGYWENGLPHGLGMAVLANDSNYIGMWKNGRRGGWGIERLSNNNAYAGQWSHGMKHGRGVYKWSLGDTYFGEYKNGFKDGYGVDIWADGDSYHGEYVQNEITGKGVIHRSRADRHYYGVWDKGYLVEEVSERQTKAVMKNALRMKSKCTQIAEKYNKKSKGADAHLSEIRDAFNYRQLFKAIATYAHLVDRKFVQSMTEVEVLQTLSVVGVEVDDIESPTPHTLKNHRLLIAKASSNSVPISNEKSKPGRPRLSKGASFVKTRQVSTKLSKKALLMSEQMQAAAGE